MTTSTMSTSSSCSSPVKRRLARNTVVFDRGMSEKTVDTNMSRGGSRSSLYSRNSSRLSLETSSRSLSSKSMLPASNDRSMAPQRRHSSINGASAPSDVIYTHNPSAAMTSERRVRRLGYTDEDKLLIEFQSPPLQPDSHGSRKPSRLRRMLSWVQRSSSSADSCSNSSHDGGCRREYEVPQQPPRTSSSSDNGLSILSVPGSSKKPRSRSAVFVKTPNGMSEGILYR